MSRKYKFHDKDSIYFVTFAVVRWVDVFTRNEYRKIVADSITYCISNKGLVVHGWVIMSNHVHLLISLNEGSANRLSDIMRDLKKFTAMQLIKVMNENLAESRSDWMLHIFKKAGAYNSNNTNFQFWQQNNHPIQIRDSKHYFHTLNYIHNNPVKAGWVDEPLSFPWSSARDYYDRPGIIPIELLDIVFVCTI